IQNNNMAMSDKIQSTLVNTIPLWKSQMVIAIGLKNSTDAAKAQREVTDMTNTLLKKNAEALKMATIETAKEAERGIIDIETLTNTNQMLISTFDEVMKIQEDGRTKRAAAEVELQRIETEMRDKLLTMSRNSVAPAEDPNIVD
ncbi:MAG: toxic anion resistance protein, partial [Lachnospiraceae bacterium]|nr:toxic anion resistance protein [Lachnospiraceae bacterium]